MRFIYSVAYYSYSFEKLDLLAFCLLDEYAKIPYEIEDTQTPDGINIIWLINSQESYDEMRSYYER